MNENYQILISKLDGFIRKYYKNKVLRGLIFFVSSSLIFFLFITFIEYFAFLNTVPRAVLFFVFIFFNSVIILRWIIFPLLKIFRLGPQISHEESARIIGLHFSDIQDKLLNILQLKKLSETPSQTKQLIEAGINQKINQIKVIPFKKAVNFGDNKKYLKYALTPLLLLILILFISPRMITEPAFRLYNYEKHFEKESPFTIEIQNSSLSTLQNSDYILEVKVSGTQLPSDIFVNYGNNTFLLNKRSKTRHFYTFRNVQENTRFNLSALDYTSDNFVLNVLPKPIILNFDIELQYPVYTHKENEVVHNTGDLIVPQGTIATWRFMTRDTRHILFYLNDSLQSLNPLRLNNFTFKKRLNNSILYSVITQNEYVEKSDSLPFTIEVIPDEYPFIDAEEFRDTVLEKNLFFSGSIKDDYGFSKLTFNNIILKDGNRDESSILRRSEIPINKSLLDQRYYYQFDLNRISLEPGDQVEYYFEIWDNDAINGSKSSRSRTFTYRVPSDSEIQERSNQHAENMLNQLQQAMRNVRNIDRNIDDINRKILERTTLNWEDKKNIEELLQMNFELQEQVENIQEFFEQKEQWEEQFSELNEELAQKQEELNKLLESLMTDEMKELLSELEKMMENLDREKVKDMLDKMKLNTSDVEKELDRSLELLKQFEFEKLLSKTIERLDSLAQKQNDLSEESKDRNSDNEELAEKQNELNEEFERLQKDIENLHQKNDSLEKPNNIEPTDSEQNAIEEQMQESSEQLQRNNKNKASQSQQKSGQMLQELADKMREMEADMLQSNLAEDIDALRMILENLIRTSFSQEEFLQELVVTRTNDPRYSDVMQNQNKLKDDLKMIEDSLLSLSKRQVQIESFVNREISDINSNMDKAIEALVERNASEASSRQQYIITHINNLALMLSESLQNMQMSMQQQSGSCNNPSQRPGQGQQSFKSLRQMQEALNQMMQDMKEGRTPQGREGQSLSEQLARMAAQQEAIRNHLQQLSEELQSQGMGNSRTLNELQQKMEQTETDIVNRRITQQTLFRQQDILTRLLEHERAENERELEEQRESEEAKNENYSNPNLFFEYKRLKEREEELLRTTPPSFSIFYKNKVNEYFYNFQE
ncbi:MAG: hypothetical protein PHT69_01300 [Bacteroidales bacterium]|nr:hypothetical protein [Bacteroidales bacterium]